MTDRRTLHTIGIMAAILRRKAEDHDGSVDADTEDDKTAAMNACCLYMEVEQAAAEVLLDRDEDTDKIVKLPSQGLWRAVIRGAKPAWGVQNGETGESWPASDKCLNEGQARAVADFANE